MFVFFTDNIIIFHGVRSLDLWTQTWQNCHLDSCASVDTRHLWQISAFHAILTTFVWAGNGPDIFKMAELHGLTCALSLLILFYMKVCSFQAQTISPCSSWYLVHLILLLLPYMKSFHCKNFWEICFSGGSRKTLQMRQMHHVENYAVVPWGKYTSHWFFSELNHFKLVSTIHYYVFGSFPPLLLYVYMVILAYTAFLA